MNIRGRKNEKNEKSEKNEKNENFDYEKQVENSRKDGKYIMLIKYSLNNYLSS